MELNDEYVQYYKFRAQLCRGKYIDEFCYLEHAVERYLVRHFLEDPEERREMKNLILDRLTFEAKRTALKAMLDKQAEKGGFKKTKNNKYPHTEMINEIRLLNDKRNHFAHYYLAIPVVEPDTIICLAEYRDSVKTYSYTSAEFDALIERLNKITDRLKSITSETFSS